MRETWGRCQRVRLVKTHLLICNLTYLGQSVTLALSEVKLPEVKVTKWPFRVKKYMSRSALTRERRWWQISALSQIAKKLLTKNLTKLTSRKTEHFLFDLTWKVNGWPKWLNSHTIGFRTSQAIRWSLSRSSITLGSEMARGVPPPPRCVLVWWKKRCGLGLQGLTHLWNSHWIYPKYMPKCSVGSTDYFCTFLPKTIA